MIIFPPFLLKIFHYRITLHILKTLLSPMLMLKKKKKINYHLTIHLRIIDSGVRRILDDCFSTPERFLLIVSKITYLCRH